MLVLGLCSCSKKNKQTSHRKERTTGMPIITLYGSNVRFRCSVSPGSAVATQNDTQDLQITTTYPRMNLKAATSTGNQTWSDRDAWCGHVVDVATGKIQLLDNCATKRHYHHLFWEGRATTGLRFPFDCDAFVVPAQCSERFLNRVIRDTLRFPVKESNDFITLFLPQMRAKPWNLVQFLANDQVSQHVCQLSIEPRPDRLVRVFMLFQGFDSREHLLQQCRRQQQDHNHIDHGDNEAEVEDAQCTYRTRLHHISNDETVDTMAIPKYLSSVSCAIGIDPQQFTVIEWGGCNLGSMSSSGHIIN